MAKPGDTVRYLNAVGGGVITRIEGQMAYVDDQGFETPVLLKDLVVVAQAGQKPSVAIFDQNVYDAGRKATKPLEKEVQPEKPKPAPVLETKHGGRLNITLAFEPSDVKNLATATFTAVLVNDSNYYLSFTFLTRSAEAHAWTLGFEGTLAPNEGIDLGTYTHETLTDVERVAIQAIAFKKGKDFEIKDPVNVVRKLNLTKFYKLHCFRPGLYFDTPVLEIPLVKQDIPWHD